MENPNGSLSECKERRTTMARTIVPIHISNGPPMSFDYSALGADITNEMRARASRIQSFQRASVLDVGRELIAAKKLVEHGFFRDWVETACQMHIRTAERLMQATLLVDKDD